VGFTSSMGFLESILSLITKCYCSLMTVYIDCHSLFLRDTLVLGHVYGFVVLAVFKFQSLSLFLNTQLSTTILLFTTSASIHQHYFNLRECGIAFIRPNPLHLRALFLPQIPLHHLAVRLLHAHRSFYAWPCFVVAVVVWIWLFHEMSLVS